MTARGKSAIEDHFDRAAELEALLERRGQDRTTSRACGEPTAAGAVRRRCGRRRRAGSGTRCCARARRSATSRSRCCWATISLDAKVPGIGQLIDVYERPGTGVIALKEVAGRAGAPVRHRRRRARRRRARLKLRKLVEKPAPGTAPSRLAIIGRYVLPPEIFEILADTPPGRGGEIQLTDALATLCDAARPHRPRRSRGERFDAGDRAGYVLAMVHYALQRARHRATTCAPGSRSCWPRSRGRRGPAGRHAARGRGRAAGAGDVHLPRSAAGRGGAGRRAGGGAVRGADRDGFVRRRAAPRAAGATSRRATSRRWSAASRPSTRR